MGQHQYQGQNQFARAPFAVNFHSNATGKKANREPFSLCLSCFMTLSLDVSNQGFCSGRAKCGPKQSCGGDRPPLWCPHASAEQMEQQGGIHTHLLITWLPLNELAPSYPGKNYWNAPFWRIKQYHYSSTKSYPYETQKRQKNEFFLEQVDGEKNYEFWAKK